MDNLIEVRGELRIMNINEKWSDLLKRSAEIIANNEIALIDFSDVDTVDGSGIQLIYYIFKLVRDFPEQYAVKNVSLAVRQLGKNLGMIFEESEV